MALVLKLPFTVTAGGTMATLVQDSDVEIAQSVALLLDTRPGERLAQPDYGVPSPVGMGVDQGVIADAIATWEARALPVHLDVEADATSVQVGTQIVTIRPASPDTEV